MHIKKYKDNQHSKGFEPGRETINHFTGEKVNMTIIHHGKKQSKGKTIKELTNMQEKVSEAVTEYREHINNTIKEVLSYPPILVAQHDWCNQFMKFNEDNTISWIEDKLIIKCREDNTFLYNLSLLLMKKAENQILK